MKAKYNCLFPFSVKKKFFLFNGEDGIIYPSMEKINCFLSNGSVVNVEKYGVNEEIQTYIASIINKTSIEKTKIRNFTQITEEQWLNGEVVHKLWLSLTEQCNMNCKYCFGEYGEKTSNHVMSNDTAKKCIDYFFEYANKDIDYYSIRFFGGEPLLNTEVMEFSIKYINERAKKINKSVSYLLTTNGTVMNDSIMKLIIDNDISINISIDGGRDAHDLNRIFKNRAGSFDKVQECINEFKKRDYKHLIARMTLSKPGVVSLKEDVKYLWSIGFNQIYIDIAETSKEELLLDFNDMKLLDQQLSEILILMMEEYLKGDFKAIRNITDAYPFIDEQLLKEACMYFNPFTIQFTPDGNVYKCCRTLNREDKYSGNAIDGIEWNNFYREFFYNEQCNDCWAKRLCGGGCKSIEHTNLYCEFTKIIYKNSLKMYVFLKENMINSPQ